MELIKLLVLLLLICSWLAVFVGAGLLAYSQIAKNKSWANSFSLGLSLFSIGGIGAVVMGLVFRVVKDK